MTSVQEFEKTLDQSDKSVASFEDRSPLRRIQHFLHSTPAAIPAIVLIFSIIVFGVLKGERFFTAGTLTLILQQIAVVGILGAAQTLIILTAGIDLSIGVIMVLSAVVMGNCAVTYGLPAPLAILAGFVTGTVCGMANGFLVSRMKLPPFIVTLGSLTAVRGVARLLGQDTTVFNPDLPFEAIGNGTIFGVPWLAIIALVTIVISWFVLRRTVLGTWIYAVGGNPEAARLAGIKVPFVLLFVYGLSGLFAGVGGVMTAARLYAANGLQLGQSYELDAIAAVILGGTSFVGGVGSIWGTLIGALIIAVLSNGLILVGVSDIWQYIIKGLVIIGAVGLDRYRLKGLSRT